MPQDYKIRRLETTGHNKQPASLQAATQLTFLASYHTCSFSRPLGRRGPNHSPFGAAPLQSSSAEINSSHVWYASGELLPSFTQFLLVTGVCVSTQQHEHTRQAVVVLCTALLTGVKAFAGTSPPSSLSQTLWPPGCLIRHCFRALGVLFPLSDLLLVQRSRWLALVPCLGLYSEVTLAVRSSPFVPRESLHLTPATLPFLTLSLDTYGI